MQEIDYKELVKEAEDNHYMWLYRYSTKAEKHIIREIKTAVKRGEFKTEISTKDLFPDLSWAREARPHLVAWIEAQGFYVQQYDHKVPYHITFPDIYNIHWGVSIKSAQIYDGIMKLKKEEK